MLSLGFFLKLCKIQVLLPDDMAVEHRNMKENPTYISYMLMRVGGSVKTQLS